MIKYFLVRDRATSIPIAAWRIEPTRTAEIALLVEAGYYLSGLIMVTQLVSGQRSEHAAHDWGGRTMPPVHQHLEREFDNLESGTIIDTRVLLGEPVVD